MRLMTCDIILRKVKNARIQNTVIKHSELMIYHSSPFFLLFRMLFILLSVVLGRYANRIHYVGYLSNM